MFLLIMDENSQKAGIFSMGAGFQSQFAAGYEDGNNPEKKKRYPILWHRAT